MRKLEPRETETMRGGDTQRKEDLENDTQKQKGEVLVLKPQIGSNMHTGLALAPPLLPATSLASLVSHFILQLPPPAHSSLQWPCSSSLPRLGVSSSYQAFLECFLLPSSSFTLRNPFSNAAHHLLPQSTLSPRLSCIYCLCT